MKVCQTILLLAFLHICSPVLAQDSISQQISIKYIDAVSSRSEKLEGKLDRQSEKALLRFEKQERKLKRKLANKDSSKAALVFGSADQQYNQLKQNLSNPSGPQQYIASLDSLTTSIKFLEQNPRLLEKSKDAQEKLKAAKEKLSSLQSSFRKSEEIKKFLKERRQYLKDQLSQLGFAKELKQINKQVFYYSRKVNEYKEMLKDHAKAERKALELLGKTKLFRNFMRKNSQLASLFRLPGDPDDPSSQASLAGLQTRAQVNGLIQQQLAAGGPDARAQFRQNLQEAQSKLNELKDKVSQSGGSSSDDIMPEGFKPNNQKTKNFLQRLEIGTNIQSQRPNGYFPVTSDIGLSLGYKFNDKSVVGIGASYKLGWGQNIRNISITHEGVGLRSFVDWKLKGSFWVSGGYEMNYRNQFNRIEVLKDLNAWQQSGLLGMSKVISLKTKFFRKTKVQLLWDFLSYQQIPRTQPIIFRIGYSFK
jgi:hypothetical protein